MRGNVAHTCRRAVRLLAPLALGAGLLAAVGVTSRAGDSPREIAAIENDLVADDPIVRAKAAAELTDRFPDGAVAVPMLVDLLDDESPEVVAAAAKAIDAMAVAAVPALSTYIADDAHWRPGTLLADRLPLVITGSYPSPESALDTTRLVNSRTDAASADEAALAALLPPYGWNRAAPHLVAAMRASPVDGRLMAACALAMSGADELLARDWCPPATRARPAAAAAAAASVRSKFELRSWAGSRVLARARCDDPEVVAVLVDALSSAKENAPASFGGTPKRVARRAACVALGATGSRDPSAARALLDALSRACDDEGYADECVRALLLMGREAELAAILASSSPNRDLVAHRLADERRAAATVVPYFLETLRKSKSEYAARAVARYDVATAEALSILHERAEATDDEGVRTWCAQSGLAISPSDARFTKYLEAQASGPDEKSARCAALVLAKHATPSAALVTRIRRELARVHEGGDEADFVGGLGRCGQLSAPAVDDLLRIVRSAGELEPRYTSHGPFVLRGATRALGRIGPDAAAAVPALTALRDKGDETIRVPAAQALRGIKAKK